MKTFVKILLIFFIAKYNTLHSECKKSNEHLKHINKLINNFVADVEKKYELHCYGSGGSMPNEVEEIDVLFISYIKSTVADARKMELAIVQELLHRVNSNPEIRPYLKEYPFGSNRVHISISFRTEDDSRPLDGSVALVSLVNNKIYYDAAEMKMSKPIPLTRIHKNNEWTKELIPGKLQEELVPLMEETYEEALKIVGITSRPTEKNR